MGLPSSISTPNFDTGPGMTAVPTSLTAVPHCAASQDTFVVCYFFANPTAAAITVTVEDTSGNIIIPTTEIPPLYPLMLEFPFQHVKGLQWQASASGLLGQIWGFQ